MNHRTSATAGGVILLCVLTSCEADPAALSTCSGLDEPACAGASECSPIRALPNGGEDEYVGCGAAMGCQPARLSVVHPTTGECWAFSSTCLPEGWSADEGCGGGQSCEGLDEATCEADPWCAPIVGAPAGGGSDYAGCWTGITADGAVACGQAITKCPHPETGGEWTFGSTCIPDGWDASACEP